MLNYSNTTDEFSLEPELVRFGILLVAEICSLSCSIGILIFAFTHWRSTVQNVFRNHIILILVCITLIYDVFDLPFILHTYHVGYQEPRTYEFCTYLSWIDSATVMSCILLTTLASIQRHILIFHSHFLVSMRLQILFHFLPIICTLSYSTAFDAILILAYQCEHVNYDVIPYCVPSCIRNDFNVLLLDWIFHAALPLIITIVANITLVFRVVRSVKKIRRQNNNLWRRQAKLTVQLFSISLLYTIGWVPAVILSSIHKFVNTNVLKDHPKLEYIYFIANLVIPLQSFVCLFSLPELASWLKHRFRRTLALASVSKIESQNTSLW